MRLTLRHVAAVSSFFLAACSGNDVTPAESTNPGNERLVLALSSQTDTVPEATTKLLSARVTDQLGMLKPASITWTSTDPTIATVSEGAVTGVRRGVASIIASTRGAADTALIVVTENDLVLDVQPSAAEVMMGDTVDFVATVRNSVGEVVAVNSFNWKVSDTTVARFVKAGSLVMKREGELSVSAEAMSRVGASTVKVYGNPVASVTITPGTANINKGGTLALEATLRDQQGRVIEGDVTWGSTDYGTVSVNQDGIVTGVNAGSAVITATSASKTGSATINVLNTAAVAIDLNFPSATLVVGGEMQATAVPLDANGQPLTGKTIAWQSANPSIATVTNTGKVHGVAAGQVKISAIVDGVIESGTITITNATPSSISISPSTPSVTVGQQAQLVARVLDQSGMEITGQAITWSSANATIATVSSTGVLKGISAGSTSITASSGSLTKSVTATVGSIAVASVRITPTSATITEGAKATLVAEALDANGNVLAGRAATWTSQNTAIATVSNGGVVTAVKAGSTAITATIEGKSANAAVTVNAPPPAAVASVTVSLANATLNVGQQTQGTATLKDASGNTLTGSVSWFSLDTTVARVNSSGVVTAYSGGTVAIMAKSGTITGSASLTVNTPTATPVARITISTPTQNLLVGQKVQTVVTLYDAAGNVLTGRTVTYASDNAAVFTVSGGGLITGIGGGSTKLRVTSGSVSNTETFTVSGSTSTAVASIAVTPATSTLAVGGTTQLSAVARDAQGAIVTGTTFTWTTSNASIATVSSSGLVSAIGAGSATISAAASGKTGTMSVTVSAPTTSSVVSSVSVTLSPTSVTVGGTSQATAVAKDANGVVIPGKTATWSLSGSSLASISASGLITATAAGTVTVSGTIDGKTGSVSLTITNPAPLPTPPTSTTVELPRVFLNYSFPAKTGQTIVVPAGGNLQTALNNAQRGDEIVLAAGATFTGNFVLPVKSGTAANGWIVVRSDKLNLLPAQGTRVSASQASLMPKIVTATTQPALQTTGAASGWWLAGLEVSVSPSLTSQQYGIITLGGNQTTLTAAPQDLVLDRMYIHGQTTTNTSRCVALNSGRTQISDSYITECHSSQFQAQAVAGWNGSGPFKIVNNMLMGSGEPLMFGGADPATPNLVPSDIEIRRNYLYTPVSWKGVWLKANSFETKNAVRVLIEANVFDGSWTHAQTGWAIILKSENQSGACRWCRTTDITIRRNLITNAGAGINIAPRTNGADSTTSRVQIYENVLENIGVGAFTGDQRGFQFLTTTKNLTIERSVLSGSLSSALVTEGGAPCVLKDNVWAAGSYGVIAGGYGPGTSSLNAGCGTTYVWSGMTLVGSSGGNAYPSGTTWVSSESQAPLAAQIRSIVQQAVSGVAIP